MMGCEVVNLLSFIYLRVEWHLDSLHGLLNRRCVPGPQELMRLPQVVAIILNLLLSHFEILKLLYNLSLLLLRPLKDALVEDLEFLLLLYHLILCIFDKEKLLENLIEQSKVDIHLLSLADGNLRFVKIFLHSLGFPSEHLDLIRLGNRYFEIFAKFQEVAHSQTVCYFLVVVKCKLFEG